MNNILDKYQGCLIGLALGDVLGVPFEFWKKDNIVDYLASHNFEVKDFNHGYLHFPAGFYSDDTAMTICLAESLTEKGFDLNDQFERYQKWFFTGYATPFDDHSYGIGRQTLKALSGKIDFSKMDGSDERAGGNGSLMRCAPIGLYYCGQYAEIKEKSLLSSYITHNYHISGWACVILNTIISLIINGVQKEKILSNVKTIFGKSIPDKINTILNLDYRKMNDYNYPISGYSVDTLRIAIWSWQTSKNYLESIKKVIMLGNDTDTFGAVTGAIAGCCWGYDAIPNNYKLQIKKNDYILSLAKRIYSNKYLKK